MRHTAYLLRHGKIRSPCSLVTGNFPVCFPSSPPFALILSPPLEEGGGGGGFFASDKPCSDSWSHRGVCSLAAKPEALLDRVPASRPDITWPVLSLSLRPPAPFPPSCPCLFRVSPAVGGKRPCANSTTGLTKGLSKSRVTLLRMQRAVAGGSSERIDKGKTGGQFK